MPGHSSSHFCHISGNAHCYLHEMNSWFVGITSTCFFLNYVLNGYIEIAISSWMLRLSMWFHKCICFTQEYKCGIYFKLERCVWKLCIETWGNVIQLLFFHQAYWICMFMCCYTKWLWWLFPVLNKHEWMKEEKSIKYIILALNAVQT